MTQTPQTPKFDTCFFERYAKICLRELLGNRYANLVNNDRPDLQDINLSIGIEVTRAIHENKLTAYGLVNDMAGENVTHIPQYDLKNINTYGYAYGINPNYVGKLEFDYWSLALPLHRILENKVQKVINGFYGNFKEFGLFVFSKENLSTDDVWRAIQFTNELQKESHLCYHNLYLAQSDDFYSCNLTNGELKHFSILINQRKKFYQEAINPQKSSKNGTV